jgi:hypothetical protein
MVAIASSSLWSFIGIDCDVSGDLSAAFPLPLLAAQLQRATHLRVYFDAGPYLAPHVIRLFQLIVEHSPRWEELYLVPLSEMFPIIATLHDRIPLLRKLWLEFNESEDFQNESEDNIECFRLAPALRDASLIFLDRTLTVPLPGHRLTRYQLNGAWEDHSEILKVAKNLAEVRIFVCDPDTPRLIPGGVIELCELRRLYVSDVDILDSLRLPALQDLGFFQEVGDPDAAPHIDSVVVRSACILRRLCVMGFPGADMITELLRKHQAIVELSVILADPDSSVNANALIGYLANRGSDDIFSIAPQLGGVFFGCQNGNSLNYQYYHDMLLSRWKSGALKCAGLITAAGSEPPPPSILHCLDTLRADGLNMLCVGGPEAFDIMSEWTLDTYL